MIKAVCTPQFGSKKIDVTYQDGKHSGMLCVDMIVKYMQMYPCLKYLVLPFKQLIFNTQMNDPYQGGLTSYALVLMIVAYLQMKQYHKMSIDAKQPNLGVLFIDFLYFFSNMDFTATEIMPFKPNKEILYTTFVKASQGAGGSMVITDPLNPGNNVARSSYKYLNLRVWVL